MIIHSVQSGESVYSIAKSYGVPPSRVITDNMLTTPEKLAVGQELIILYPEEVYTVQESDTLQKISRKTGVSIGQLFRNNPQLNGATEIYQGQILNIRYGNPPNGTIKINGYAYPFIERDVLRRTLPYLTYLSVFSYGIDESGNILPSPGGDEEMIALARAYETVPLLVLTPMTRNGTFNSILAQTLLEDPVKSSNLRDNLVKTVIEKGYGGVDMDFEYVPAEAAEAYASFIASLREALPPSYVVFTALAPKTSANQPGLLYGGHNYNALGKASDYLLVMTYEWGYTYGPPMAVSPLPAVKRVLDYAVTEIPRKKLFMGIPNYGYDWRLPYVRGETKAESLSNVEAVARAIQRNAAIQLDDSAVAPYYTYFEQLMDSQDTAEHEVWFENATSTEAMLSLVREYGIQGASVWNIQKYFPALWLVLNQLYTIEKAENL